METEQIHATCIAIEGIGVLLLGEAGVGKSDLALRLIDEGAKLVADDRVELSGNDGCLRASAPKALLGKLEVRGVGVAPLDSQNTTRSAVVRITLDLVARDAVERMPEPQTKTWVGVAVPLFRLNPFEASTPAKVRLLADGARRGILPLP